MTLIIQSTSTHFVEAQKSLKFSHFNFSAILTCTEHREIEFIHQQPNLYIYRERQADTFKDSRDRCYQKDTSNSEQLQLKKQNIKNILFQ